MEIVLVCPSVSGFHVVEQFNLGQDELEQSAAVQVVEALAWVGGKHDFIEFVGYPFCTDDFQPVAVSLQRLERLVVDIEIELCGEPYAPHHTERVVGEGDIGVEWRADETIGQVVDAIEGVDEFAKAVFVETDGHGIDGEVAPVLVVIERAVLHDRFPAVVTVTLFPGAHELHLHIFILDLRRPEIAEYGEVSPFPKAFLERFGHLDAAPYDHHIDIVGRPLKEDVPDVSSHHIAFHSEAVGHFGDAVENILVENRCQFGVRV